MIWLNSVLELVMVGVLGCVIGIIIGYGIGKKAMCKILASKEV